MENHPITALSIRLIEKEEPLVIPTLGWSYSYDSSISKFTIHNATNNPVWEIIVRKEGKYFSLNDGVNEYVIYDNPNGVLVIGIRPKVQSTKSK